MTRSTILIGYALIGTAMLGYQLTGLVSHRNATIGQALSFITRRRAGRWIVLAGWLWVGAHFFVRSHVGS